jgi:hypothetical protein
MKALKKTVLAFVCLVMIIAPTAALANQSAPQTSGPQPFVTDGSITGVPWTGEKGITETVAQIMEREKNSLRINPSELHSRPFLKANLLKSQNPDAPTGTQGFHTSQGPSAPLPLNPQIVGTNFLATVLSESGYIPPDTMGAVGPTQILVALNGRIKVFDKQGNLGGLNTTTDNFFNSVRNGSGTSDPHVRYDRLTQRWFVVIINVASTNNRVLIAVSNGPTITDTTSFTFYFFQHNTVTPIGDDNRFLDYPTLGVDANALYIGGNMFGNAGNYVNSGGFVVRKSSVTSGGPIVVTAFRNLTGGTAAGLYTPQGVDNDDPGATEGYFIGVDVAVYSQLVIRRISTPGGTPTISTNINLTVPTTDAPILQPAQGSTINLDSSDDRLFAAAIHRNKITGISTLWTAHNFEVNSSCAGVIGGGRNGSRWYEIGSLTTAPALVQSGTLCDPASTNPRGYTYPSVVMSGQGHMALGATFASANDYAGIVVAGRLRTDTSGTTQAATVAQAGGGSYTVTGTGTRNRWGDFSQTVVDPNDDQTLWTFQEYASATNTWAVRAIQLRAPLPATPASISSVAKGQASAIVTVTGTSTAGTEFFDPGPDTGGPGYANHITATLGGATGVVVNGVTFVDPTHVRLNLNTTNAAQGCPSVTVVVTNPDGQTTAGTFPLNIGPVWIGGGGNSNWSNSNNWAPAAVPGASDLALFDPACVTSANATVDTNQTVGSVTIKSGYAGTLTQGSSNLSINGAYQQQGGSVSGGTGTITLGGTFNLTGGTFTAPSGGLLVAGNFTNTATFTPNLGTVTFNGAGLQILVGNTTFNNVAVSTGVTVSTSSLVTVTALANSGWTSETLAIAGTPPFTQSFGLANVKVSVGTLGALNSLQIVRRDQNHPNATAGTPPTSTLQTGRYWIITPNSEGTFSVTLVLPHNNANLPEVCKYPGGLGGAGWDCAVDGFTTTTVWRSGISNLSDWSVGANTGPTAIHLTTLDARGTARPVALLIAVLLVLSLSLSFVILKRRRA